MNKDIITFPEALHTGKMTFQEVANFFGISRTTFSKQKEVKLVQLTHYCTYNLYPNYIYVVSLHPETEEILEEYALKEDPYITYTAADYQAVILQRKKKYGLNTQPPRILKKDPSLGEYFIKRVHSLRNPRVLATDSLVQDAFDWGYADFDLNPYSTYEYRINVIKDYYYGKKTCVEDVRFPKQLLTENFIQVGGIKGYRKLVLCTRHLDNELYVLSEQEKEIFNELIRKTVPTSKSKLKEYLNKIFTSAEEGDVEKLSKVVQEVQGDVITTDLNNSSYFGVYKEFKKQTGRDITHGSQYIDWEDAQIMVGQEENKNQTKSVCGKM